MSDGNVSGEPTLVAGPFASWMTEIEGAIRGERGSDVPCDGCTACCTSSQFVHIEPDETDTLAHIPPELLFAAPGRPRGHVLLGYDERGHCPMLVDNRCSIYEHRPRTCRTYDCRVLAAVGVGMGDADRDAVGQDLIARRAQRWRFSVPTDVDRRQHEAVRAAAAFLVQHPTLLPVEVAPTNPTQLAVLAIAVHDLFLPRDDMTDQAVVVDPDPEMVRDEVMRRWRPPMTPPDPDRPTRWHRHDDDTPLEEP